MATRPADHEVLTFFNQMLKLFLAENNQTKWSELEDKNIAMKKESHLYIFICAMFVRH